MILKLGDYEIELPANSKVKVNGNKVKVSVPEISVEYRSVPVTSTQYVLPFNQPVIASPVQPASPPPLHPPPNIWAGDGYGGNPGPVCASKISESYKK